MVRGVPWDHLPNRYEPKQKEVKIDTPAVNDEEIVPHKFDPAKDLLEVGRRTAFGLVVRVVLSFYIIPVLFKLSLPLFMLDCSVDH